MGGMWCGTPIAIGARTFHRSEPPRLMAMRKPLRTRGQMPCRGGGENTSNSVLSAQFEIQE